MSSPSRAGAPCTTQFGTTLADYDTNHDGTFNILDYSTDPRVTDRNGNGYKDPEDLIVAFSDGTDHDGNGYVDDISGWDFYNHQNDPATLGHRRTRMPTARCGKPRRRPTTASARRASVRSA